MRECGQEALGGPGELVQLVDQPVTRLHREPLGSVGLLPRFTSSGQLAQPPAPHRAGRLSSSSLILLARPPRVQASLPLTPGPCAPGCSRFL